MNQDLVTITVALQSGGVAVVRTDTIYGIIALADDQAAVEKVFSIKQRDPSKQCIVLISSAANVPVYGKQITLISEQTNTPTSVIVPATNEPEWLLRGGDSIAYRLVADPFLRKVIESVGPVIAPSANPEGLPPARTVAEALRYFGTTVDCYIDGGEVPEHVSASQIIRVEIDGTQSIIRPA